MRAWGALWMLAFLVWLPFEDTQIWTTVILASAACLWLAGSRVGLGRVAAATTRGAPAAQPWWRAAALGAAFGAAIPLIALILMAFKSGAHGHGFADFTSRQLWQLVELLPLTLALGCILGLASRRQLSAGA